MKEIIQNLAIIFLTALFLAIILYSLAVGLGLLPVIF